MRGGFSKVCFIVIWKKKSSIHTSNLATGSRPSLLLSSRKPSLTVPVLNPFLFSVLSAALLKRPIYKHSMWLVARPRWAWGLEHKGRSPMAPMAVWGLPVISYLAHSMLQGRTKGGWLPSVLGSQI